MIDQRMEELNLRKQQIFSPLELGAIRLSKIKKKRLS